MIDDFGRLHTSGDLPSVEFERVLDSAIDVVWAFLTTEEGLEHWMAPSKVDLRLGGTVDIDFGEGGVAGGEILDLVPGVALEYRWRFTGEPDSIVRFELEVIDPDKTRLRLHHRMLPPDQAVGYGAGWHAYLDRLGATVTDGDEVDWLARFQALLPEYQARAG